MGSMGLPPPKEVAQNEWEVSDNPQPCDPTRGKNPRRGDLENFFGTFRSVYSFLILNGYREFKCLSPDP